MSFKDIHNQQQAVQQLKSALENDKLPHTLIFQGPPGSGQKETAKALAMALLCDKPKDADACGECVQCHAASRDAHPDLMTSSPEEDSSVIKVDEIRSVIGRANLKPFQARRKVFIIDPAERMNDTAQNAFLKTLEEPAGFTHFILITSDSAGLLPTIRSRAQTVSFVPSGQSTVLDPAAEKLRREALEFILDGGQMPPDQGKLDRAELSQVLDALAQDLRDLLVIRSGAPEISRQGADRFEKEIAAKKFTQSELVQMLEDLSRAKERLVANVNIKLTLAVLWEEMDKAHAR